MRTIAILLHVLACMGVQLFMGTSAWAQGTARLDLYVQPSHQVVFLLDGKKERLSGVSSLELPEGPHHFTFWAPDRRILDTTITFTAGHDMELHKVLPATPEYEAYREARAKVQRQRTTWKGLPALATLGFGVWAIVNTSAHNNAYDRLQTLEGSYATMPSPGGIARLKYQEIPDAQQELKDTRARLTTSLVLCGASAAVLVYGFIRAGRYTDPPYEDKEKVRFDGLVWMPGQQGGQWMAGLTLPIR